MLGYVLKMTRFNSRRFQTPDEQIIKYCMKFLSRNFRHCAPGTTVTPWLDHRQYYGRVFPLHWIVWNL